MRGKSLGEGVRMGSWCLLLVKEKYVGTWLWLGKHVFLDFFFMFKDMKIHFKYVLIASAH